MKHDDNTEHLNVYDENTIGITKHLNGYDENTEHKAESVANGCLAPDQAGSEHNFSRPCFFFVFFYIGPC